MRAAVVQVPGRPPRYADHADPQPGPGETLIRVTAAPVVPLDLLCASGTSYFGRPACPYVPGVQGVGVVEASGQLPAGTRVWFASSAGMAPGDGSLAERCAVADGDVVPVDAAIDDAALAALGLSGLAAWMTLSWRARLQPGEHVALLGAGGAVGQAAIGAARVLGAGRVVAVARSAAARERALALGADVAVPLEADVDAMAGALAAAAGNRLDVVVDPVFGTAATAAARVLSAGGRLVNLGGAADDTAHFSSAALRSRSIDLLGYTNNALTPRQRAEAITRIAGHGAAGEMAVAHEVRPLADVTAAWQEQAEGRAAARLVLQP